jgi:hypothetical protein
MQPAEASTRPAAGAWPAAGSWPASPCGAAASSHQTTFPRCPDQQPHHLLSALMTCMPRPLSSSAAGSDGTGSDSRALSATSIRTVSRVRATASSIRRGPARQVRRAV